MDRAKTETIELIKNLKAELSDRRDDLEHATDHNDTHAQVVLAGKIAMLTNEIARMERVLKNFWGGQ